MRSFHRPWSSLQLAILSLLSLRTNAQTTAVLGDCFDTINAIALRESLVSDTSFERVYKLCPSTTFEIGTLDFNNEVENGQKMLPLKANIKIQCGESGSRSEGCLIEGGDVQVDGTDHFEAGTGPLDNVVVEGLTFVNSQKYMVWLNRPGNVEFKDCEFRENRNATTPVLLDYFDKDNPASELSVKFLNCMFDDNTFSGMPSQPALVVGNGRQNRLIIEQTRFLNNDMIHNNTMNTTNSFLIETSGPLTLVRSCFENNQIGVAPVGVYGGQHFFSENYQFFSTGKVCSLASHFDTEDAYENFQPRCERFDIRGSGAECPVGTAETRAPTPAPQAPTASPSVEPTVSAMPSIVPTSGPTLSMSPSSAPIDAPTASPTASPTGEVLTETSAPTKAPTGGPVAEPVTTSSPVAEPVSTASPTRQPVTPAIPPERGPELNPTPPVDDPTTVGAKSAGERRQTVVALVSLFAMLLLFY